MPRVVFTGDSQTCGRVGAWDYPQMLSWELPIHVLNTSVGGTNTRHLLQETSGGTAEVTAGAREVRGTGVSWHAGPYPGQTIRLGPLEYTIDRIVVESYADRASSIWLTAPAREDFAGTDYAIEPGWRVRVRERRPDYVCFMYSVNDSGWTPEQFRANVEQMVAQTRELGAVPILLSGFPYMDRERGGSHPGANWRVCARAEDLAAVASERSVPFGDVLRYLLAMDEQSTSVWVDTVHPTTEGSLPAILALRRILGGLGVAHNPYYVRGYRCTGDADAPPEAAALTAFTTGQPDYAADGSANESLFDLAAIEAGDEYGLLAEADGRCVRSEVPVVLQFGIGDPDLVDSAVIELTAPTPAGLSVYDRQAGRWLPLGPGRSLDAARVNACCREGALWIRLEAESGALQLDYAAVVLHGRMEPYAPRPAPGPILWPDPELLSYDGGQGSLLVNGDLSAGDERAPVGWVAAGETTRYIRRGEVARGEGEFVAGRRVDLFRAPGRRFTRTARALDTLQVRGGPEHACGGFLVSQVVDDETLRVRRLPETPVAGLSYGLVRSSGCGAVPGGCAVQCSGHGSWTTTVAGLPAGRYRLSFFHRAYAPERMEARGRHGGGGKVTVRSADRELSDEFETSFVWQKRSLVLETAQTGAVEITLRAAGEVAAEYTGLSVIPSIR